MKLHFCGVRGSTPGAGPEFVALRRATRRAWRVSTATTRRRSCSTRAPGCSACRALWPASRSAARILLGHLHWDHTHGLPFFPAGDDPDAAVDLYMPAAGRAARGGARAGDVAAALPDHARPAPRGLELRALEQGEHAIEGFQVLAREIPHKGGRTFGYRVSATAGRRIAYLSDHSPTALGDGPDGLGEYHEAALALATDVDVLVHDAQYTAEEFAIKRGLRPLGHRLRGRRSARIAGVGRLLLFHHDPARTDDQLDAIVAHFRRVPSRSTRPPKAWSSTCSYFRCVGRTGRPSSRTCRARRRPGGVDAEQR